MSRTSEKKYKVNEFVKINVLLESWPMLNHRTVQRWCADGKYPYALRRGKYWYVHPEQFRMWFEDVGPSTGAV